MAGPPDLPRADWLFEYPPARSLLLDQEALRIYEHAYYLGIEVEKEGDPPVSFTTVMAALLSGKDLTSRWFARTARKYGPNASAVLAEKRTTEETVRKSSEISGKPDSVRLSDDKNLLTSSARAVIGNAENWAHQVGGSDIGVRHLVAAYVLNPPAAHRDQMQNRWDFQEAKWRSEFFEFVTPRYTAEQWADSSRRVAPTKAVPTFEQQKIKGKDLAYPGDDGTVAILDTAARFHARRNDQWLRLQTVFYALVETARNDASVRDRVKPVYDAVSAAEREYSEAQQKYFSEPLPAEWEPFSALDISPRVLNALETARELAVATRHDTNDEFKVGAMHLAGAIISRRVDGDEELLSIGVKPQQLRLDLIEHAKEGAESGELWREALGEEESLQSGRPVDLNSDEPDAVVRLDQSWESDPLSIRRDVESFAALLASKSLEPPLSIGLFGPWGSGKTTFLKRLRRSVERRAQEATSANTPYFRNIVHVEFNAWHFAEDALTSSLVDTIFRELSDYIGDKKVIAGLEWKEQKRQALESTKRKVAAADAVREAAEEAVKTAQTNLTTELQKAESETTNLHAIAKAVWKAAKKSLQESGVVKDSGILDALGDAVNSTDDLEARLRAVRARPARMLSDLGLGRTLLFVILVLVLPPAVAWLVGKALNLGQIGQVISSTSAILSVIALWASAASKAVSRVDQAISTVANEYAARVSTDPKVVEAQQKLKVTTASAATAAASLQVAREELARAQAEAANASLPAQMLQLVSGRIEDQSYARELTTLSLARADLAALSRILGAQRIEEKTRSGDTSTADSVPSPAQRAVDRVILYIDDLDRCKPADVVRVLQLVHMLLAFELFVVVVAVDARWVEQSLIESYRWLAPNNAETSENQGELRSEEDAAPHQRAPRVTPQDYLEKIFQISFWLEPMTSARAASYLASLVRAPAREVGVVQAPGISVGESAVDGTPVIGKIGIAGIELDYMRALAAYVGPSPRRVKRLVNAYRLIKARMTDTQLSTFLTDRATEDGGLRSGPYQIVIALLVIGTGAPASSANILKELAGWDPTDGLEAVVEKFRGRNNPDWTMAAQVIEMVMQTQKAKDVSELRGWARKVGRFLLNSPAMEVRERSTRSITAEHQPSSSSGNQAEEDVE